MRRHVRQLRHIVLGALLVLVSVAATAQNRNRIDNRGKEFRIAFLHTNGFDDTPKFFIDVWCQKATRGRLTYLNSNESYPIDIPVPYTPVRVELDPAKLILPNPKETPISTNTLRLDFDDEVTIYGINTQRWSSDAFLALPKPELGTHYVVMSYPNTIAPDPTGELFNRSDFPSQFAVVATEDNTTVTIKPTVRLTNRTSTDQFSVLLNSGDIFFAQAENKVGLDLTGTEIRSNQPVVVYGSHQRANIPYNDAVGRDHLVEQLLPVSRWTNRPILTPHYQIPKTVNDANIARVMALNDDTELSIDSTFFKTLKALETVEIPLNKAELLTATGPIQVAQFQHSTVDDQLMRMENDSIGDPFMMLAFAPEQFDSVYAFESYNTKDFKYHFINVVIPTERIPSLLLDGGPVNAPFVRIPKTSYSYAQIPLKAGFHQIRARAPFGLYIYGYGPYNSYGVPGAVVFDTLYKDQKPPLVDVADTCGGVVGVAHDDSTYDFGMEDIRLLNSSNNVTLQTYPFAQGDPRAGFRINLIDPYQDGYAEMVVVDTAGLDNHVSFPVKGFTVALSTSSTPVTLDTLASLNGMQFCTTVRLRNYGQFPQEISAFDLTSTDPGLSVDAGLPVVLQPGEEREFSVCYRHSGDTAFTVGLSVTNGCIVRDLAIIPVISGVDSLKPYINSSEDPCKQDKSFEINEAGARNAGIKSITFTTLENADPIISPSLPSKNATLVLRRQDARKDLIYDMTIEDLVGNKVHLADTLGGFTLLVQRLSGEEVGLHIDNPWTYEDMMYGQRACDTVRIQNYGLRSLKLSRITLLGNLQFSIPPEQLPFDLPPGGEKKLAVCVVPISVGEKIDTLEIDFNCAQYVEQVELKTLVTPLPGSSRDKCGNAIAFQIGGFARANFLEAPTPNPVSGGRTVVTIGLSQDQPVTLGVHDALGNEVLRLLDNDRLPAGIAQIDMNTENLSQGIYYLLLRTADGDVITQKLVVNR